LRRKKMTKLITWAWLEGHEISDDIRRKIEDTFPAAQPTDIRSPTPCRSPRGGVRGTKEGESMKWQKEFDGLNWGEPFNGRQLAAWSSTDEKRTHNCTNFTRWMKRNHPEVTVHTESIRGYGITKAKIFRNKDVSE
jgi:hypothetical protein